MFDGRVVLVNYRTADRVRNRVRELRNRPDRPVEIVVVDNEAGSGLPGGLDGLQEEVRWVAMPRNVGFAAGVNRGMQGLELPYALWLNPDARPEPGCLGILQRALAGRSKAAVAAAALYPPEPGVPVTPSATRCDPTGRTLFIEYGPWGAAARRWLDRHYFLAPDAASDPVPCAAAQGACFAVRRDAWEQIGPLDAGRFFLYWEETDFCRRARSAGWAVLYCPRARCEHEGGASVDGGRQDAQAFWRSADAYFRKHRGARRAAGLRMMMAALTAASLAACWTSRWMRPARRTEKTEFLRHLRTRWRALRTLRKESGG